MRLALRSSTLFQYAVIRFALACTRTLRAVLPTKGLKLNPAEWEDETMPRTQNRLRLRPRTGATRRATIASCIAAIGFALIITAPCSAPRAETDCSSLDLELRDSAEFTKINCDEGSFRHGDISGTFENIIASNSHSVYSLRHEIAGTRTYIIANNPKTALASVFSKSDDWAAAPGGDGFSVMRFK